VGVYAGIVLLATRVVSINEPVAVAGSTLAAFATRLKDAVDLDAVQDDLAGVVTRALEPVHVSVWISRRD
jgi:hypothetical protein